MLIASVPDFSQEASLAPSWRAPRRGRRASRRHARGASRNHVHQIRSPQRISRATTTEARPDFREADPRVGAHRLAGALRLDPHGHRPRGAGERFFTGRSEGQKARDGVFALPPAVGCCLARRMARRAEQAAPLRKGRNCQLLTTSWQLAVLAWLPATSAPAANRRRGQRAAPPEKRSQLPTANSQLPGARHSRSGRKRPESAGW